MCRCRPSVRTPCCGSAECHALVADPTEPCRFCARPARPPSVMPIPPDIDDLIKRTWAMRGRIV